MKVILTTNIKKLGKIGDLVNVKDGFARNFLFPNKMALRKNKKNMDTYEKIKDKVLEEENNKRNEAKEILGKISDLKIKFTKECDEKGQLYGSITKRDIVDYLNNNNLKIKSDDVVIKETIKSIGNHEIEINPYVDLKETFTIEVNKN
tara:strand:+ start:4812 stop:5255 length:444 start_codon:yes stop_codon:yes gene_type:complete